MNKRNSIVLIAAFVLLLGIGFVFKMRNHPSSPNLSPNSETTPLSQNKEGAPQKTSETSQTQPGTPQGNNPAAQNPGTPTNGLAQVPTVPEAPKPPCYLVNFHHKQLASHRDEESCSHHKNILKVDSDSKVNPASVCIRVNGTPVKYGRVKGKADEFMVASIAGPQAKISIRYCRDKEICSQDCKIPKDEFMDAIGGTDEAEAPKSGGKWDPNDKESDMNAEVDEVQRNLASIDNTDAGTYVFRDWVNEGSAPTCAKQ